MGLKHPNTNTPCMFHRFLPGWHDPKYSDQTNVVRESSDSKVSFLPLLPKGPLQLILRPVLLIRFRNGRWNLCAGVSSRVVTAPTGSCASEWSVRLWLPSTLSWRSSPACTFSSRSRLGRWATHIFRARSSLRHRSARVVPTAELIIVCTLLLVWEARRSPPPKHHHVLLLSCAQRRAFLSLCPDTGKSIGSPTERRAGPRHARPVVVLQKGAGRCRLVRGPLAGSPRVGVQVSTREQLVFFTSTTAFSPCSSAGRPPGTGWGGEAPSV